MSDLSIPEMMLILRLRDKKKNPEIAEILNVKTTAVAPTISRFKKNKPEEYQRIVNKFSNSVNKKAEDVNKKQGKVLTNNDNVNKDVNKSKPVPAPATTSNIPSPVGKPKPEKAKISDLANSEQYIELSAMVDKLRTQLEIANMRLELVLEKINIDNMEKYILTENRYIEFSEFHTRVWDTKKDRSPVMIAIKIIREMILT